MNAAEDIHFDDAFLVVPDEDAPDFSAIIALLNELYIAESRSFFRYLDSWEPYTDANTIKLRTLCRGMMRTSFRHSDRLAKLIESLGGVTITGAYSKSSSDANYTSWANLLPRFIATKRDMIARGQVVLKTLRHLPGGAESAPVVAELMEENAAELAQLEQWQARLAAG